MRDLFVVHDVLSTGDEYAVVPADSAPEAAVAAANKLPTPYLYSDGTPPARKLSVYRAEKVGEFAIHAEEA